jgi:accessory gene regulator B
MFDKMSKWITSKIYSLLPDVPGEKREVIEYGAYMLLSETVKISAMLFISAFLNIFHYAAAAILVFGLLRMTLGGIHAKTHWGCIISYFCFIYGIIGCAFIMNADRLTVSLLVIPYILIISYRFAPADMPVKPVLSKRQRRRLRIQGFVLLAVLLTGAQFLPQIWFNIIMLTCALQSTLMTPLAYRLTKNKYGKEASA